MIPRPKKTSAAPKITLPPKKATLPKKVTEPYEEGVESKEPIVREEVNKADPWDIQKEKQLKQEKPIAYPKMLIFGRKWTGKTHVAESAYTQGRVETSKFIYPSFSPVRVIDCGNASRIIAAKDFPEAYTKGEIVVIRSAVDQNTGELINDPIERIRSVKSLINKCKKYTDGCLVIDEFDKIERDCVHYIYRQYNMYEKENGELWKRASEKFENGHKITIPEERVRGIIPRMYTPRNNQLRDIISTLLSLNIPVILVAHEEKEYDDNETPTGKVESNLREFVDDDMDFIIRLENVEIKKSERVDGRTSIIAYEGRQAIIYKNRYQKEKAPEVEVIQKEGIEFTDIFSMLLGDNKNATNSKEIVKADKTS